MRRPRHVDRDTLNLRRLHHYRPNWPWAEMLGSGACLKWSSRDLANLDACLGHVVGRKCVVQAGGNLGIFPKRLAEEFKRVISFEPDAQLLNCARRNAPERNILWYEAALGDSHDGVRMSQRRRDQSGRPEHEGLTHVAGRGKIPQIRLDELGLHELNLLYLDIEGYELFALRGAADTVARCRPVIAVEINKNIAFYGESQDAVRQWITGNGYRFVDRLNSDEIYVPEERA